MKFYFDHYGKEEDNFAQITIHDSDYDEKIDVINIEKINKNDFKNLYNYLTTEEKIEFIYEYY